MFGEIVTITSNHVGPGHPSMALHYLNYGISLSQTNLAIAAVAMLEKAVRVFEANIPPVNTEQYQNYQRAVKFLGIARAESRK